MICLARSADTVGEADPEPSPNKFASAFSAVPIVARKPGPCDGGVRWFDVPEVLAERTRPDAFWVMCPVGGRLPPVAVDIERRGAVAPE
ncbi:hypothetical protein A9974_08490 [Achromobacter sp. UMC71]|nr:hypothetical protein [Achromobacter sp. UMC71]